jgi:hypothetical protein
MMSFDPSVTMSQVKAKTNPQDWIVIPTAKFGSSRRNLLLAFVFVALFSAIFVSSYTHVNFWVIFAIVSALILFWIIVSVSRRPNLLVLIPEGFLYYSEQKDSVLKSVDYRAVDDLRTRIISSGEDSVRYSIEIIENGERHSWMIPKDLSENSKKIMELIANAYAKVPPKPAIPGDHQNHPVNLNAPVDSAANNLFQQPMQTNTTSVGWFHPQQILQSLADRQADPTWEVYPADSSPKSLTIIRGIGILFIVGSCMLSTYSEATINIRGNHISVGAIVAVGIVSVFLFAFIFRRKKPQQGLSREQLEKVANNSFNHGVWLAITPLGVVLGNTNTRQLIFAVEFNTISTIAIDARGRLTIVDMNGRNETLQLNRYFRQSFAIQLAIRISQWHQNIKRIVL